jgi:rhodanese-related sulfurtransferase
MTRASRTTGRKPPGGDGGNYAETALSTLIDTDELAAHLDDPAFVIVDVRHDLAQPDTFGDAAYAESHIPGARFAHVDRDLSAPKTGLNGRHPLPTPEAVAALFRAARHRQFETGRRLRSRQRHVRLEAVVDAALARPRSRRRARRRIRGGSTNAGRSRRKRPRCARRRSFQRACVPP